MIARVEIREGGNVYRTRLQRVVDPPVWRMWVAERAFRFGARLLGFDIKLVGPER